MNVPDMITTEFSTIVGRGLQYYAEAFNTTRRNARLDASKANDRGLRIIHTLGGCGGTLLSRCIGVLPGVALLSEVNPASVKLFPSFDPIYQDTTWLQLLTKEDAERCSRMDLREIESFRDLIQVFYDRATASDRQ